MTQTQIPGTERDDDPDLVAILQELRVADANCRAANKTREAIRDRAKSMLVGLNPQKQEVFQRAFAVGDAVYHYTDDQGDEVEGVARLKLTVSVRKTGAAETPIGEAVDAGDDQDEDEKPRARKPRTNGVHPGMLAAAERDGNVEVSEDGDVVVPEKSAKRTKAKKPARRKR